MTLSLKVASVWEEATNVAVKVSGTWKQVSNVAVKVSGTWKSVWSYLNSILPNINISHTTTSPTNAHTALILYANGVYRLEEAGSFSHGNWTTRNPGAAYDIKFTKTVGDEPTSGSATNTILNMNATRSWVLNENTDGDASKSFSGYIEMRANVSQTLLSNTTFSATAEVLGGG